MLYFIIDTSAGKKIQEYPLKKMRKKILNTKMVSNFLKLTKKRVRQQRTVFIVHIDILRE